MQFDRAAAQIQADFKEFQSFILQKKQPALFEQLIKNIDNDLKAALDYEDKGYLKGYAGTYKYKKAYEKLFEEAKKNNFKILDNQLTPFNNYLVLKEIIKKIFLIYEIIWEQYKYIARAQGIKIDAKEVTEVKLSQIEETGSQLYQDMHMHLAKQKLLNVKINDAVKKIDDIQKKIEVFKQNSDLKIETAIQKRFDENFKKPALIKIDQFKAIQKMVEEEEIQLKKQQEVIAKVNQNKKLSPGEIKQYLSILESKEPEIKIVEIEKELKDLIAWNGMTDQKPISDLRILGEEINNEIKQVVDAKNEMDRFNSINLRSFEARYVAWLSDIKTKVITVTELITKHQDEIATQMASKLKGDAWKKVDEQLRSILKSFNELTSPAFKATSQSMLLGLDLKQFQSQLSDSEVKQIELIQSSFVSAHRQFDQMRQKAVAGCTKLENDLDKERNKLVNQLKNIQSAQQELNHRQQEVLKLRNKMANDRNSAREKLLVLKKQYELEASKRDEKAAGDQAAKFFSNKKVSVTSKQMVENILINIINQYEEKIKNHRVSLVVRKSETNKTRELSPDERTLAIYHADLNALQEFKKLITPEKKVSSYVSYRSCWDKVKNKFPITYQLGSDTFKVNFSPRIGGFFENLLEQIEPISPVFINLKKLFDTKYPIKVIEESKNRDLVNLKNLFLDANGNVDYVIGGMIDFCNNNKGAVDLADAMKKLIDNHIKYLEDNQNFPKDKKFQDAMKENWLMFYKDRISSDLSP